MGAIKAPTPLKDCAKFKRCSDEALSPNLVMYGLATVSKNVAPLAIINKATRKKS